MYERLPIPDCPETLAFRAVVNVIRSDPTLRRLNVSLIVWDGSPQDLLEPVSSLLPFVEMQPAPDGAGWSEADQHRSDVGVDFTLAVKGTNADDLLNLWGVVRTALFPDPASSQRATIEAAMTSVGIYQGELVRQPFQVVTLDSNTRMLVGEGRLKLRVNVNT